MNRGLLCFIPLLAGCLLCGVALGESSPDAETCDIGVRNWGGTAYPGDETIAACTRAIQLRQLPSAELARTYMNRGQAWLKKGDIDRAIADFTEVIRLNPRDNFAYSFRGRAWSDKGDYDRAIADFTEVIRVNPKDDSAYMNRGLAWRDKGDYDRAIADFNEALRISSIDLIRGGLYRFRGDAWVLKGDYDRAISDYDKSIRLNPAQS